MEIGGWKISNQFQIDQRLLLFRSRNLNYDLNEFYDEK